MGVLLEPGVAVEAGRYAALVSPPGFLADLLLQPEADRCTTLCLYGVSSRSLHGLPRQAPRLAVQSRMAVRRPLASLREAYRSIVIVEHDHGIFTVGRTLRELSHSSTMLLWAPRAERGFRALMKTAGKVVWHYAERPVQATLG